MSVYSKSCPFCHAILYSGYGKEAKYLGKSMQRCPYCNNESFNDSAYEWENLTNDEKKIVLATGVNKYIHFKKEYIQSIIISILFIWMIIPIRNIVCCAILIHKMNKFKFDQNMIENNKEILESIERTKDPEYRKLLILHGRIFYGDQVS